MPEKEVEYPEISGLESELYSSVVTFFRDEKKCSHTGSAKSFPISLQIFGGTIYPDVFGAKNPLKKDYEIYMAEGKRSFGGREFDDCKGQAISLQRFADYVYTFFPKAAWEGLSKEEQDEIQIECKNLQIGLLIIKDEKCEELVKPARRDEQLKEEKKQFARDKIVQFFPDYLGLDENKEFFDNNLNLADSVLQECYGLIEELSECVTNVTGISKQSIKHSREDSFEFYLRSKTMNNGRLNLLIKPFGSPDYEIRRPILMVEEIFNRSLLRKERTKEKLTNYIDECLKNNFRIKTQEYIIFAPDTLEDTIKFISNSKSDEFRILKPIEISGREKKAIKGAVEKHLKESIEFMNSVGVR